VDRIYRRITAAIQILLATTFTAIPISRILGAPTLQQVLDLGAPTWLIWAANVVELAGATLLLAGLRRPVAALAGATLIACSMTGATLLHLRAGNLFNEVPWTLVILTLALLVIIARRPRPATPGQHAHRTTKAGQP
jgi:hypothetical protein